MTFTSPHIGRRLRAFRELKGFTQQQLELELNASFGHISKIESGKVNPTKETILAIGKILNLNYRELDYLIGVTAQPVTIEEKEEATREIESYFARNNVFAYLLDERWRFHLFSNGFIRLYNLSKKNLELMIGMTTVESILDESSPVLRCVSKKYLGELWQSHIPYYYAQTYFMQDDPSLRHTVDLIEQNPITKEIWEDSKRKGALIFNTPESRKVHFKVGAFHIPLLFSREPLMTHSRFEVIEYNPTNRFLKALSKLKIL